VRSLRNVENVGKRSRLISVIMIFLGNGNWIAIFAKNVASAGHADQRYHTAK